MAGDHVKDYIAFSCFLQVSHMYGDCGRLMAGDHVKDYIPFSWLSMAQVKKEYYAALAHKHVADALLDQPGRFLACLID